MASDAAGEDTAVPDVSAAAIGERIRDARVARAWTHEELARRVGVNWRTVQRWQKGENLPRVAKLLELAEILEIPREDLVRAEGVGVVAELAEQTARLSTATGDLAEELARAIERIERLEERAGLEPGG